MKKFHITEEGEPGVCHAIMRTCPFGGPEDHYSSENEAREAFEESQKTGVLPKAMKNLDPMALDTLQKRASSGLPKFHYDEICRQTRMIETIDFIPVRGGYRILSDRGEEYALMDNLSELGYVDFDPKLKTVKFTKIAKDQLEVLDLLGQIKVDSTKKELEREKNKILNNSRPDLSDREKVFLLDSILKTSKESELREKLQENGFGTPIQTAVFIYKLSKLNELLK